MFPVDLTRLTRLAVKELGLGTKEADRCRNFFAMGPDGRGGAERLRSVLRQLCGYENIDGDEWCAKCEQPLVGLGSAPAT